MSSPALKDPLHDPLELACLIAAEERHATDIVPRHVSDRIHREIEQIMAPAAQRVALSRTIGSEVDDQLIAQSVASALFGTRDAPDDAGREGFFRGASADYYDPGNSFLDSVLERRQGIPISLSLIAADACRQLGCPMVGLNTPMHLLLAPADPSQRWVMDCYNGGEVMSEDAAAEFIAARIASAPLSDGAARLQIEDEERRAAGGTVLSSLRAAPMTALSWGSRMLRNLRAIHSESGDVVGLIGVADRLRLIGAHSRVAVSDAEMRECAAQVALCIYMLRWRQRRTEAACILESLLRSSEDADERARIEDLRAQPFFADASR